MLKTGRRIHPSEDKAIAKPQRDQNRGRFRDMTRINDRIRAREVRVIIGSTGQQLGILKTDEAVIPRHVAIVMDGNGRWAQRRHLPRVAGHKQGVDALRNTVRACLERGVQVLTVFAFSSENWSRPVDEVSGLMDLLVMALSREVPKLTKNGVRLYFPGDRSGLSPRVVQGLQRAQDATAHNQRMVLNVCFNYGGRWDIVNASRAIAQQVQQGEMAAEDAFITGAIRIGGDAQMLLQSQEIFAALDPIFNEVAHITVYK